MSNVDVDSLVVLKTEKPPRRYVLTEDTESGFIIKLDDGDKATIGVNAWEMPESERDNLIVIRKSAETDEKESIEKAEEREDDIIPETEADHSQTYTDETVDQISENIESLAGASLEQPPKPIIQLKLVIDEQEILQAVDGLLTLRWNENYLEYDREEIEKRLGLLSYYTGILITAANEAEGKKERTDTLYESWLAQTEHNLSQKIMSKRQAEVKAGDRKSATRITKGELKAAIMTDKELKKQYLGLNYQLTDLKQQAKQYRDMIRLFDKHSDRLDSLYKGHIQKGYRGRN